MWFLEPGNRSSSSGIESIPNCFTLSEHRQEINNYFTSIYEINQNDAEWENFLSVSDIETGYVAPQQLLTGLLGSFAESWPDVLDKFKRGENIWGSGKNLGPGLIRSQRFTFFCWLLWGPSISLCRKCNEWGEDQEITALQYGFGDENNSFSIAPLIDDNSAALEAFNNLLKTVCESPFARPARVTMRPLWIDWDKSKRKKIKRALSFVGRAQREIWRYNPDKDKTDNGNIVLDYVTHVGLKDLDSYTELSSYYSSYIWVMFILCDGKCNPLWPADMLAKKKDPFDPIIKFTSNEPPWYGMFPFFVHGNIGESNAYELSKQQLVGKALTSIDWLIKLSGQESDFTFRYACASDHPNCNKCSDYKYSVNNNQSKPIRDLLKASLKSSYQNITNRVSMDSTDPAWKHYRNVYSSCHLPEIIDWFYGYYD
ncbi:MAG: hypothetical protein ACRESZ_03855 [Methylococcales bacterium]